MGAKTWREEPGAHHPYQDHRRGKRVAHLQLAKSIADADEASIPETKSCSCSSFTTNSMDPLGMTLDRSPSDTDTPTDGSTVERALRANLETLEFSGSTASVRMPTKPEGLCAWRGHV